jgi:hypothetical protein
MLALRNSAKIGKFNHKMTFGPLVIGIIAYAFFLFIISK